MARGSRSHPDSQSRSQVGNDASLTEPLPAEFLPPVDNMSPATLNKPRLSVQVEVHRDDANYFFIPARSSASRKSSCERKEPSSKRSESFSKRHHSSSSSSKSSSSADEIHHIAMEKVSGLLAEFQPSSLPPVLLSQQTSSQVTPVPDVSLEQLAPFEPTGSTSPPCVSEELGDPAEVARNESGNYLPPSVYALVPNATSTASSLWLDNADPDCVQISPRGLYF